MTRLPVHGLGKPLATMSATDLFSMSIASLRSVRSISPPGSIPLPVAVEGGLEVPLLTERVQPRIQSDCVWPGLLEIPERCIVTSARQDTVAELMPQVELWRMTSRIVQLQP